MDNVKSKLADVITGRLSAAPNSVAKAELIEELSENLYQHYQELLAAGQTEDEAFRGAVDALGDTGELVNYLKGLEPGDTLPPPDSGTDDPLGDILRNVEDICKEAMKKAKSALDEAKANFGKNGSYHWISGDRKVEVHVDGGSAPSDGDMDELDRELDGLDRELDDMEHGQGWDFSVDVDRDGFFAGGGPKKKDVIYGFGYDKAKGGFFTQWGEYKGKTAQDAAPFEGPIASDALRGIVVEVSGDVTVRMTEEPEGDVVIDGDVDHLETTRLDDGTLAIREVRTASSAFLFRRGMSTVDVELAIPRRSWDFLRILTGSGDVEIEGDQPVGQVLVKTGSGDLEGRLPRCGELSFRSGSGDLHWEGDVERFNAGTASGDVICRCGADQCRALRCKTASGDIEWDGGAALAQLESASGDIRFTGRAERISVSSMSGEVDVAGGVAEARCSSFSGNVKLESDTQPRSLEIKTKSGDCEIRMPDAGPFAVKFSTVSGCCRSDFFEGRLNGRNCTFTYGDMGADDVADYRISTVSGDLYLYKY